MTAQHAFLLSLQHARVTLCHPPIAHDCHTWRPRWHLPRPLAATFSSLAPSYAPPARCVFVCACVRVCMERIRPSQNPEMAWPSLSCPCRTHGQPC